MVSRTPLRIAVDRTAKLLGTGVFSAMMVLIVVVVQGHHSQMINSIKL